MTAIKVKWTLEQYHRMVGAGVLDDERVELLRGEIVQMSPEGIPHASKRTDAQEILWRSLGDRVQVRVGAPITLPNGSEPEPDLAIVQRTTDGYAKHHPYPENVFWLMEYSNTSLEKDLGIKAEIYAEANIQEYWVVNLKDGILVVFRDPAQGRYRSRQEFTQGTICPLAFADVEMAIERLVG